MASPLTLSGYISLMMSHAIGPRLIAKRQHRPAAPTR
jgi:hypothetical protein